MNPVKKRQIRREFLRYVTLNILGQIAYSCYTLADTFFVSADCGTNGLTSLNLAFPVFCLVNGIGLMTGIGGSTRYSILKSCGNKEAANQAFTHSAFITLFFSVLFFTAGVFGSETLTSWLGADDSVFSMTHTYLKVMLLFSPAFLINHLLLCFVRNDGSPSLSAAAMITGSISNIILDYIFIFPMKMGIFGAIFATGLSPVISTVILSSWLFTRKNQFHLVKPVRSLYMISQISATGIPSLLTETASGIVMFLFNVLILRLEGNTGVAAFGIVSVVSLVNAAIYNGLSQGIQPVISLHYGSGSKENSRESINLILAYALAAAFLLSGIIYSIIYLGASPIAAAFNSEQDPLLQILAVKGLRIYFTACPFIGFTIVITTLFTSTERPVPAQILSLCRSFLILVPTAVLFSRLWHMTGVWAAYPGTECIVSILGIIFMMLSSFISNRRQRT